MIKWKKPDGGTFKSVECPITIAHFESHGYEQVKEDFVRPIDKGDFRLDLQSCKDKTEIENLVIELTGIDIDKRGSIDTVRSKAMKVLEDYYGDCSTSS